MKTARGKQVAGLVAGLTSEDATACRDILERLKQVANVKSDGEIARALGLKQSSVSTAKTKGVIPPSWIINASNLFNVSADWLIFGDEKFSEKAPEKAQPEPAPPAPTETKIVPDSNKMTEDWVLALLPAEFKTLWDQFWEEIESRRGWLQVELIQRFPEFIEWLKRRGEQPPTVPPIHPGTLRRGGMGYREVGVHRMEDD